MNNINFGETLKSVRMARHISQKNVTDAQFTRSLVAKIESNEVIPTISKFQIILQQLNLSFDEFFFIHQEYQLNDYQELVSKFYNNLINSEENAIANLIVQFDEYLKEHDNFYIHELKIVSQAILKVRKNQFTDASALVTPIWERISKVDIWTHSDLKLINCILFMFPNKTAMNIGKMALAQLEKYDDYLPNSKLKIAIKLNLTVILLKDKNYSSETLDLLLDITNETKKNKFFDYYAIALFRQSIYYRATKKPLAEEVKKKSIDIFSLLEEFELLNGMYEEEKYFLDEEHSDINFR